MSKSAGITAALPALCWVLWCKSNSGYRMHLPCIRSMQKQGLSLLCILSWHEMAQRKPNLRIVLAIFSIAWKKGGGEGGTNWRTAAANILSWPLMCTCKNKTTHMLRYTPTSHHTPNFFPRSHCLTAIYLKIFSTTHTSYASLKLAMHDSS